jgi:carbon monoxide dehydrogenase subunit G
MFNYSLERSIVIDRPVEDVFAFVSNSENRPKWVRLSEVRKLTKGPVRVGTTFSNTVDMMGRKWESPFPCQLDHFFKPVAEGTQVTLRLQADYGGVSALAGLLMGLGGRRQMQSDLAALKKCLEGQAG